MKRSEILKSIEAANGTGFDVAIIGGGATGLGCAVDAVSRGFKTVLVEKDDFGKGTSSKSTKLVHGGVRYLEQGHLFLVTEALQERGRLLHNAPHLVSDLKFVIPNYSRLSGPYYMIGLKLYDLLAGKPSFGASHWLDKKAVLRDLPNLNREGLRNGIAYYDGQFDDTRLLISLLRTFLNKGGQALNYAKVTAFRKNNSGKINGLVCHDKETKTTFDINAKVVINASGVYSEMLQKMDDPDIGLNLTPSQGSHVVVDGSFLGNQAALMIPKTPDGRVLFAIPWHGKTLLGTTDVLSKKVSNEPKATAKEIDFILETAGRYFVRKPSRGDVLSTFAGIRPLVSEGDNQSTKTISRSHKIFVSDSGLVSITGGKWTTYRRMAEDTVNKATQTGALPARECKTREMILHGGKRAGNRLKDPLHVYGSDANNIHRMKVEAPELKSLIHKDLPYSFAEVVWACKWEMAARVEDVLARRTRALFLNARAASEAASIVAEVMRATLGKDELWKEKQVRDFRKLARKYMIR